MKEVKSPKKPMAFYYIVVLALILLFNEMARPYMEQAQIVPVDYSTFMQSIDDKTVDHVEIQSNQILYTVKDDHKKYKTGIMNDPTLAQRLMESGATFTQDIKEETSPLMSFFLAWILPLLIFFAIGQYMSRKIMDRAGGNSMMFGGSGNQAKIYVPSSEGIHFSDVAGEDEAKENLSEIVDYLHNPSKYTSIGASMPKGVLLVGPPGTGKTMLAKAVAGEANVPFFSIAGSEFVEMFVGMGASKVRDLFKQAKEKAPCIVFIDEIDAIGQKRTGAAMGNDEREQTLNQLLTEMDGFDANKGLVILAATNRPESLDKALLRPGRFDRRIIMELPDLEGRKAILRVHLKDVKHGDIDLDAVGRATAGSSGADIANIVNEAALRAVRLGKEEIETEDLEESVETVIAGEQKKGAVIAPEEKRIISYHEIGHAMVAACQSHSAPVQKITIIPRTSGALGYTMQVDAAEKHLMSRDDMLNQIATLCGGRAAEEVMCHTCTTGASNDIEKATQLARAMVTTYGMSEKYGMMQLERPTNRYLGGNASLTCSAETARDIDTEVRDIIRQGHEKAVKIITEHAKQMDTAAAILLKKETITGAEFMQVLQDNQ